MVALYIESQRQGSLLCLRVRRLASVVAGRRSAEVGRAGDLADRGFRPVPGRLEARRTSPPTTPSPSCPRARSPLRSSGRTTSDFQQGETDTAIVVYKRAGRADRRPTSRRSWPTSRRSTRPAARRSTSSARNRFRSPPEPPRASSPRTATSPPRSTRRPPTSRRRPTGGRRSGTSPTATPGACRSSSPVVSDSPPTPTTSSATSTPSCCLRPSCWSSSSWERSTARSWWRSAP